MTIQKKSNTVLVTGGLGLLGNGIKLALERYPSIGMEDYDFVYVNRKDGDLLNKQDCENIFEKYKPTHVIHLAAQVGGLYSNMNDMIGYFRNNLFMNDNVVQCCHKHTVKTAIFCLSTCVYPVSLKLPYTEGMIHDGAPDKSNEGYAHGKRMLECLVRYYREAYNYDWSCIVPTNLYGMNDNYNIHHAHVLPAIIHKFYTAKETNGDATLFGTGTALRQFLYNVDAGRIILKMLKQSNKLPNGEKIGNMILCDDIAKEYTIRQLSDMVGKDMQFDQSHVTWDKTKSDGVHQKTASNDKLRGFIGNDFKYIDMEAGLKETINWFTANYNSVRK